MWTEDLQKKDSTKHKFNKPASQNLGNRLSLAKIIKYTDKQFS